METHGVLSQWAKRLVLESALPAHLHHDLDEFFMKEKTEAGQIYYDCKTTLIKIYG